jgi:hypothetical protein
VLGTWLFGRSIQAPYLSPDAYQYIDVVRNVDRGECVCTHVAHFDEQVAPGRMPVEFTHFPPLYPLLMAALSQVGISPESAGLAISVAGFLITFWLIWDMGLRLGAEPWAIGILSLLWVGNSHALLDATRVGTEALFTALVVAMAALMVRDLSGRGGVLVLPCLGLIAGAAYWLRYAGFFLIPVVGLYLAWRFLRKPEARWQALAGLIVQAALTVGLMARNIVYVGSWRGGLEGGTHRSLRLAVVETVKAYYHLVFGDRVVARFDAWGLLFCLSLAATVLLIARAWRKREWAASPKFTPLAVTWISFILLVYVAGVTLTFLTTIASDLTRYTRPVYPLALVLAALVISATLRGWQIAAAIVLVGSILAIHSRSLMAQQPVPMQELTRDALSRELQPGVSASAWLLSHVPPGQVMIAADGQAVQYLLHRDVVALIEPHSTSRRMDEPGVKALMTRFGARYLLLFPQLSPEIVPEQANFPFLRNLASGSGPTPDWLVPAARNSQVAVYECEICARR